MKTLLLLAGIWGILLPAACLFHWVRNVFYRRRFSGKAGAVVTSPSPGSVRYTYTVNDTAYFRELGSGFMDRCGTCVDIRYDPSAPSLSRRDRKGWESCVSELLCVLLLPGFALCPVLCAFSPTEEAPAVVRECREFRNSSKKKKTSYRIAYSYPAGGSEYLGSAVLSSRRNIGERITVCFDPAHPSDSVLKSNYTLKCLFALLAVYLFSLCFIVFTKQPGKGRPVRNGP